MSRGRSGLTPGRGLCYNAVIIRKETLPRLGEWDRPVKKLLNRETILYLIFGVLTAAINYLVFWLGLRLWGEDYALLTNVVCFVAASTFAYLTNKIFVFESKSWQPQVLGQEIVTFYSARIFSFLLEEGGLWICKALHAERVALFGVNGLMVAKILLSLLVVLVNYAFSKLLVFKKR